MFDDTANVFPASRQRFIGGSDAWIIMGNDEAALLRLWREKRGEVEPEDLSGNLIVQLGPTTSAYLRLLTGSGFRRRTPGPPPSWSMNSTPAASKERLITSSVARRGTWVPASRCRTVTIPTAAFSANSPWLQPRRPRAALHCSGVTI